MPGIRSIRNADRYGFFQLADKRYPAECGRPSGHRQQSDDLETIESWNVGFDWGLFDNRLTGSFDYYNRYTYDMIGPASVAFRCQCSADQQLRYEIIWMGTGNVMERPYSEIRLWCSPGCIRQLA